MSDFITFSSSLLPRTARVVGFRGTEAISRLYRFDVFIWAPADNLDFELSNVVGTKARLALGSGAGILPCFFSGVVGDIELIEDYGGKALLRVVIVPRLAALALSRHSRVFTEMSVMDVIAAVLEENGVDRRTRCALGAARGRGAHLPVPRERSGLHLAVDGAGGHLLLLRARGGGREARPRRRQGLPRRAARHAGALLPPDRGATGARPPSVVPLVHVPAHQRRRAASRLKRLRLRPAHPQASRRGAGAAAASGEVNLYGERFFTPGAGERLAQIRARGALARQGVFHAQGARHALRPGYTFELEDHPRAAFNASTWSPRRTTTATRRRGRR